MTIRFVDQTLREAGRGFTFKTTWRDSNQTALGPADIATLTLQLYDLGTGAMLIGSSTPIDVKGVGRGSFDATTKEFSLTLSDQDNALANGASAFETHIARLACQINAGLGLDKEVQFTMKRLGP